MSIGGGGGARWMLIDRFGSFAWGVASTNSNDIDSGAE